HRRGDRALDGCCGSALASRRCRTAHRPSTQHHRKWEHTVRPRMIATMSAFAAVVLLAGCTSATPEANSEPQSTDSDQTSETTQGLPDTSGEYLDDLYAASLHDGISPADPGTAYIEVAGERFEFENLDCTVADEPDRGQFIISAGGEATGSGHRLYLSRQIGSDIGFAFEEENVQLSLLVVEDGAEKMSNAMAQHERDQGEAVDWI